MVADEVLVKPGEMVTVTDALPGVADTMDGAAGVGAAPANRPSGFHPSAPVGLAPDQAAVTLAPLMGKPTRSTRVAVPAAALATVAVADPPAPVNPAATWVTVTGTAGNVLDPAVTVDV